MKIVKLKPKHKPIRKLGVLAKLFGILVSLELAVYISLLSKRFLMEDATIKALGLNIIEFLNDVANANSDQYPYLGNLDLTIILITFFTGILLYKVVILIQRRIISLVATTNLRKKSERVTNATNSFFSKARQKDKIFASIITLVLIGFVILIMWETLKYIPEFIESKNFNNSILGKILKVYVITISPLIVFVDALGAPAVYGTLIITTVLSFLAISYLIRYIFFTSLLFVGYSSQCSACKAVFATSDAGIETIERYTEWKNESVEKNGRSVTESVPYNVHRYWQYTSCDICDFTDRRVKVNTERGGGSNSFSQGREFGKSLV
jgi:hypothetical protein